MGERSGERNGSRGFFKRLARRHLAALSLAGLVLLVVTAAALAVTGDLTQPAGTAGCVSEDGCGALRQRPWRLTLPNSVAVSADGKSVYVASGVSDAVTRLNRNTTTGAITQPAGSAGCVSQTGAGPCADGHALNNPVWVAVSADGKSVYVASVGSDAVAHFNRNTTTGAITQPAGSGRLRQRDRGGDVRQRPWARRPAFQWPSAPTARTSTSPRVGTGAVVRLNRNTSTGALTQPAGSAGCVSDDGLGPLRRRPWDRRPDSVWRSASTERASTSASHRQQRRGALQPQRDHRGDHPARGRRRLRQRDGGRPLRQRPWAQRRGRRWRSARTERASTSRPASASAATLWLA